MTDEALSFAKLEFDDGSTPGTFDGVSGQEIINISSITPPGATRPEQVVTNLQSTSVEKAALLPEFQNCSFEVYHVPTDTSHGDLLDDSVATSATVRNWKLEIQNPATGTAIKTYEWIGQLLSFVPEESPNAVRTASAEVIVNSGLTIT